MPSDLRCLVLDDDRDWIELIRRALVLARLKVEIIAFVEAEAALAYLRRERVELILSDIRMPGMDGLSFICELRRFDAKTPVILVSSDTRAAEDPVAHGANAFVRKGSLNTQLSPAIHALLPGAADAPPRARP